MRVPNLYSTGELFTTFSTSQKQIDGKWVSARPEGLRCIWLRRRLKLAWLVFTGRADALVWPGGQ